MAKRKISELTKKQTFQYKRLSRKFKISEREYKEYYDMLRKSRRKSMRMARDDSSLFVPHYSYKIENILNTRKDFLDKRRSVRQFLKNDYKKRQNLKSRANIKRNLMKTFENDVRTKKVIGQFMKLSDKQLNQFLMENPDIQKIAYDSQGIYRRFLSINLLTFINRWGGV